MSKIKNGKKILASYRRVHTVPMGARQIEYKTMRVVIEGGDVLEKRGNDRYRWVGSVRWPEDADRIDREMKEKGFEKLTPVPASPSLGR
jgi:hypothetical protein